LTANNSFEIAAISSIYLTKQGDIFHSVINLKCKNVGISISSGLTARPKGDNPFYSNPKGKFL
jgi:short-subunit dehydrogenase involved in D-alanine esterification of teichoic acids